LVSPLIGSHTFLEDLTTGEVGRAVSSIMIGGGVFEGVELLFAGDLGVALGDTGVAAGGGEAIRDRFVVEGRGVDEGVVG